MSDYAIVAAGEIENPYEGSDVPGAFRSLTESLGAEQLAVTLIQVPPHSDFEQGTGHFHAEIEELYLVTRGTLTMRFGDEVEIWAVSRKIEREDSTKIDDFWASSPEAKQHRD